MINLSWYLQREEELHTRRPRASIQFRNIRARTNTYYLTNNHLINVLQGISLATQMYSRLNFRHHSRQHASTIQFTIVKNNANSSACN